jgi:hypothetical protein
MESIIAMSLLALLILESQQLKYRLRSSVGI